jgi:hypothetical protein
VGTADGCGSRSSCPSSWAYFAGILYALPVGVVSILAFDWYFLPPLRILDGATMFVLGMFLVMSVIVGRPRHPRRPPRDHAGAGAGRAR